VRSEEKRRVDTQIPQKTQIERQKAEGGIATTKHKTHKSRPQKRQIQG
jgi:hypothetical protein